MKKMLIGLSTVLVLCGCNDRSEASTPKEYCGRLADRGVTITSMRDHDVPFEDVIELLHIADRPAPDQKRLMSVTRYVYSSKDDVKVVKANVLASCYDEFIAQKEAQRKEASAAAAYTPTPVVIPNGSGGMTMMMF